MQKVSDQPLINCPACSQPQLVKLVSAAGFRLKGGGWYETDFKRGGEKKRNLVGDAGEAKSTTDKKAVDGNKASTASSTATAKTSSGTAG